MTDEDKKKDDEQNVIASPAQEQALCGVNSAKQSPECSDCNCETLKSQAEEYKSGWQRAVADYQNLVKETDKRRGELAQYAKQTILEEFIPIYENFKKAFQAASPSFQEGVASATAGQGGVAEDKSWQGWKQGIEHIMKQFREILKAHDVEEIKTVGEKFDPAFHEAVSEQEKEGVEPGIVILEVEGGYKMGDKVIKAAKVIVAK